MKKIVLAIFVLLLISSIAGPVYAAGTTASLSEKITPAGGDGSLEVTWVGKPDEQGYVYMPVPPGKAAWKKTEVKGGTLVAEKPAEAAVEGLKALRWQVKPAGGEVTLKVLYSIPKLFTPKEAAADAEGGPTQRGDVQTIKYAFENTLPAGITNYAVAITLPEGTEIFRVVSPKKYSVTRKDGVYAVSSALKGKEGTFGLLPGKSNTMEFEYIKKGSPVALWAGILVLSAVFLLYRREVLKPGAGGK